MWSTPITLRLDFAREGLRLLVAAYPAFPRGTVRADGVTVDEHERAISRRSRGHVVAVLGVDQLPTCTGVDLCRVGGGGGDEGRSHGGRDDDEARDELLHQIAPFFVEGHQPGIGLMCTIIA